MTPARVAAVLAGPSLSAIGRQTQPLVDVFAGPNALAHALESEVPWLWLLAPSARAREDALEHLLGAVAPEHEPRALLVAGMVLDGAGRPLDDELPAPDRTDMSAVIRLVALGLCPVRHCTFANCLIQRVAFERSGLPDTRSFGRHAAVQWTARALGEQPGRFCAGSVVVLHPPTRRGPRSPLADGAATLRMARSGVWTRGESLRALAQLAPETGVTRRRRAPVL
jgi:hypothetical protein